MAVQHVNDFISNLHENLDVAARALAKSKLRQMVFDAIYTTKKGIKTLSDIEREVARKYGRNLSQKQILMAGKVLANIGLVEQVKVKNRVAYRKRDHVHQ